MWIELKIEKSKASACFTDVQDGLRCSKRLSLVLTRAHRGFYGGYANRKSHTARRRFRKATHLQANLLHDMQVLEDYATRWRDDLRMTWFGTRCLLQCVSSSSSRASKRGCFARESFSDLF